MDLPVQHCERLEKLAANTPCVKGHECLRSCLETLSEVEVVAEGRAFLCFSDNAWRCGHSEPFGRVMLWACPVRQYIAKHLGRREAVAICHRG